MKEDFKYKKERKILKDEVGQNGKKASMSQPGIEPGTPADAAGALPTELLETRPEANQNEWHLNHPASTLLLHLTATK